MSTKSKKSSPRAYKLEKLGSYYRIEKDFYKNIKYNVGYAMADNVPIDH